MGRIQEWLEQARQNGEDPLIKIIWIWGMILVFRFAYFIWNTFLYGGIELLVSPETAASVVAIVAGLIFVIWYMRKE